MNNSVMIKSFKWEGYAFKADPEKCYNEIESIKKSSKANIIKSKEIVDFAKDSKTELHNCFTWDDSEAAEKYRIFEARQIVNSIVVVIEDNENEDMVVEFDVYENVGKGKDRGYLNMIYYENFANDEMEAVYEEAQNLLKQAMDKIEKLKNIAQFFKK